MKRLIAIAFAAGTLATAAMPTKDELAKVQPVVNELMKPLIADFKAKKKTALDVGNGAFAFANDAETEAAKFLLLKGALAYYSRANSYDRAADVVDMLQRDVKNIPSSTMMDVISRATSRINERNAPRLYAHYRRASAQVKAEKEIKVLEDVLKKSPEDEVSRRRHAELLVVIGDEKEALNEFAKLKDKTGQNARAELDGNGNAAELGEFWWGYKPSVPEAMDSLKMHAAEFYRKAIEANAFNGLKKKVVEQRIASVESAKDVPKAESSAATEVSSSADAAKEKPVRGAAAGKPVPAIVKTSVQNNVKMHKVMLNEKVGIEFAECPAGSFTMGFEDGARSPMRKHKVTFTRPFWIARTKLTIGQYKAWNDGFTVPKELAAVVKDDNVPLSFRFFANTSELNEKIRYFCGELTRRFKNDIPYGYVFRLPTEAEWEYAYTANETDPNDFYGATGDLLHKWPRNKWQKYMFDKETLEDRLRPLGFLGWSWGLGVAVGQLKPNRWGLYDMAGNCDERMLDVIRIQRDWRYDPNQTALTYADEEIDPIKWVKLDKVSCIARGGDMGKWAKRSGGCCVRLVVGPNLLKEKWNTFPTEDTNSSR